jgi:hypothetical protein
MMDGSQQLRVNAARLHVVAATRLRGRDAAAVHELAALMEQRADALAVDARSFAEKAPEGLNSRPVRPLLDHS